MSFENLFKNQNPAMSEPKKKRMRVKDSHRWTEQQTLIMLQLIREAVADGHVKYEQPTSQKFYSTHCQHSMLVGIDWRTMKSKMRYLKGLYMKAITWREKVGSELFKSDKTHVEARMKTICPYYNLLNSIFEPMLPADPIRLTDHDFSTYLSSVPGPMTENDFSMDATDLDDSESESLQNEVIANIKNEAEDRSLTYEEVPKQPSPNCKKVSKTNNNRLHERNLPELVEETPYYESQFELECEKLAFERKKLNFDVKYQENKETMTRTQLNFEKEKLEFEKRKFFEDQRLRKYEIDKQFEIKKLEIEKDERLQRLELEMKYRYKPSDVEAQYDERNEYN